MKIRYPVITLFTITILMAILEYLNDILNYPSFIDLLNEITLIAFLFCPLWIIYTIIWNIINAIKKQKGYQPTGQEEEIKRLREDNKMLQEANDKLVAMVQKLKKEQEKDPWEK